MTTQDRPIEMTDTYDESATATTPSAGQEAAPTAQANQPPAPTEAPAPAESGQPGDEAARGTETAPTAVTDATDTAQHETSTEEVLFAEDELADLRARWAGVQAAFVDDPKDCVQKADVLVSDLVDQLTSGFAQARSRLEEQWARGEDASTEDLRVALMHYREFFERLLAV